MKVAEFETTPKLDEQASLALLKLLAHVKLTDEKKAELKSLSKAASDAFKRPLPAKNNAD